MKYLLDTHIWLWSLLDPGEISDQVQEILRNDENELYLSPITVWEILTLAEKGKIELDPSPEQWVIDALQMSPVIEAPLSHAIVIKSKSINLPH